MRTETLLKQFNEAPIAKWFKGRLTFAGDGSATVALPARKEFEQATGVLHGAVFTFAADTAAWFTAAAAVESGNLMTSSFTLHLLRAVRPSSGIRSTGTVVKRGRTVVVVRAAVTDDDGALVAEGLWSHVVVPEKTGDA